MDKQSALESLNDVAMARLKTAELRNYRGMGSIVSVWGLVWFLGFGAQAILPTASPWVWGVGWLGALAWTFTKPAKLHDFRALATWSVVTACLILILVVTRADQNTAAMIFALALAASYAILGIWLGNRFLALAAIVLGSASCGWWLLPHLLNLILALGGGGALILGGIWLRRP